ncbi:MAG: zinc ribbon domain-containing protein [Arenicellales bacterium]|jgi:putative FmdB family regulatory protein
MPIYEYVCQQCDHHLEALQKLSDEPLIFCPECGEASLRKQVSAAAFRLKGTGWYETDFKNSGKQKEKTNGNKTDSAKGGQSDAGGKESVSKGSADSKSSETTSSSGKSDSGKKSTSSSTSEPA